jgi:crossover junction endodeoxyribonuclease RuvC
MRFIGIDNGYSGGWAVCESDGKLVAAGKMPILKIAPKKGKGKIRTEIDSIELHRILKDHAGEDCFAAVEYAAARPGQGVSSMFSFGKAYGAAKAVCSIVCGYLVTKTVMPMSWQKDVLGITGDTKESSLEEAKRIADESGVPVKIGRNHGISDAICLAVWASRNPEKVI